MKIINNINKEIAVSDLNKEINNKENFSLMLEEVDKEKNNKIKITKMKDQLVDFSSKIKIKMVIVDNQIISNNKALDSSNQTIVEMILRNNIKIRLKAVYINQDHNAMMNHNIRIIIKMREISNNKEEE